LLWGHVRDDAPDGLSEGFCPEIPDGVDDSAQGEVDNTLFRANPAELGVIDEMAPGFAPVRDKGLKRVAFDAVCEVGNCRADDFVAAADCEGLSGMLD
jgi:hypothetical protein